MKRLLSSAGLGWSSKSSSSVDSDQSSEVMTECDNSLSTALPAHTSAVTSTTPKSRDHDVRTKAQQQYTKELEMKTKTNKTDKPKG